MYDDKLAGIKQQIDKGIAPTPETVRTFLTWFEAARRRPRTVALIRRSLEQYGLETDPDFEVAYFDGPISFIRAGSKKGKAREKDTLRIGILASANRKPVAIKPDSLLCEAVTLMLTHDFSQLPVWNTDREVKGVITWKTIGSRLALNQKCELVRDCLEQPRIVKTEDSLFSVITDISEHDYVLVRAADKTICGIVTAADFGEQFHKLAEPFLLIGEIEAGVRELIHGRFTASELAEVRDPNDSGRNVDGVSDLSFGEYIRLLENERRWKMVGLALDRVEFVKRLNEIREIRNDIMHFEPEGPDEGDLKTVRDFFKFINRLRELGAIAQSGTA